MGARFTLTEKQVRDLIAMTPPGYTAQVTVSFQPDMRQPDQRREPVNPADLIEP